MVPPELIHYEIVKEQETSSATIPYANPAEVLIMTADKVSVNTEPFGKIGCCHGLAQVFSKV